MLFFCVVFHGVFIISPYIWADFDGHYTVWLYIYWLKIAMNLPQKPHKILLDISIVHDPAMEDEFILISFWHASNCHAMPRAATRGQKCAITNPLKACTTMNFWTNGQL